MNWTRTILDGLAMAAYFNLFAATVALYQPRLMFPSYPPAIIKAANRPPTPSSRRRTGRLPERKTVFTGFGSALESCCLSFFMVRSALWRAGQPDSGVYP